MERTPAKIAIKPFPRVVKENVALKWGILDNVLCLQIRDYALPEPLRTESMSLTMLIDIP